jgi:phosphoribosylglycinamide formyltransferase-1
MMMRVAILVSGRGSNMEAILKVKESGGLPNADIALVLSDNVNAPALEKAQKFGVKTVFVDPKPYRKKHEEYDAAVLKVLQDNNIEFIVLAGFMRLLSRVLIDAYPNRIINIHPALLPAFPGLHAQKQALDHGVKVSGCTVHIVDGGVDTGPIILQAVVPVLTDDTEEMLSERILEYEHRLMPRALDLATSERLRVIGRRVIIDED